MVNAKPSFANVALLAALNFAPFHICVHYQSSVLAFKTISERQSCVMNIVFVNLSANKNAKIAVLDN